MAAYILFKHPRHDTQDDLFYESLTVWETLKYAAFLRLPQHMSKDAKKQRVERVIAALGLQACKDTIIGGPSLPVPDWVRAVCLWLPIKALKDVTNAAALTITHAATLLTL